MDLTINNLKKRYGNLSVFDQFNLTLNSEKRHCLFGPSGCGKTTLLNCLAGLESMDSGTITGINQKKIAYVFQEERLMPWLTVKENVAFVLEGKMSAELIEKKVDEILELVQLTDFKNYYPNALSGGMKQRVSLARAFVYHGEILILDEPFKGLQHELKKNLMDYVIKYWSIEKPHLIFTTHDIDEALYLSSDIFVMEGLPATIKAHIDLSKHDLESIRGEILELTK